MADTPKNGPVPHHMLATARLRAVQGLYELEQNTDATVAEVVTDFITRVRHEAIDDEGHQSVIADADLLGQIIHGVTGRTDDIDGIIQGGLTGRHMVHRLESVLRQILRAGVYELLMRHETPAAIIINDYIEVGHAFYEGKEPKLIHAVLDKAGKTLRDDDDDDDDEEQDEGHIEAPSQPEADDINTDAVDADTDTSEDKDTPA